MGIITDSLGAIGDGLEALKNVVTGDDNLVVSDIENSYIREAIKAKATILNDSNPNWTRVPYQVDFGEQFTTLFQALKYAMDMYGNDVQGSGGAAANALHNSGGNGEAPTRPSDYGVPEYFGRPFFKDTRLGMNDAINCIWQFNRDDDIAHMITRTEPKLDIGEGRVYSSTTEQNQQIAWFTFGVPRFTDLTKFYSAAVSSSMARIANTGFAGETEFTLGSIFGKVIGTVLIYIPAWLLSHAMSLATRFKSYNVGRFYQLRPTMHLYYKYVDSILAAWLVNAGLYGNASSPEEQGDGASVTADPERIPIALQKSVSIWDILRRKCTAIGQNALANEDELDDAKAEIMNDESSLDDKVDEMIKSSLIDYDGFDPSKDDGEWQSRYSEWSGEGWFDDTGSVIAKTAFGATQFVGFRVEKGTDASESFSNSTRPSPIAEEINSFSSEARSKAFDFGQADAESKTGFVTIDALLNGFGSAVQMLRSSFDLDKLPTALVGGAFIDIPEQYASSDFGKSHSLNFQLRSPYGDIISIYQSIMVPLAMILAGALPRAAGANAYTSPFLCRVYCKGMFSIPLGIIESVSIKRGSSEFGWTYQNLPTCIDVSITIKDLSPVMYIGMKGSELSSLFGDLNTFDEYLQTLAGMGLMERTSRIAQIKRNLQYFFHRIRNTYTNPLYWAHMIGDSAPAAFVGAFMDNNHISTR